jgi:hypothetical protein
MVHRLLAIGVALLLTPTPVPASVPTPGCDQFAGIPGLTGEGDRCLDNCCGGHDKCWYDNDCLGAGAGSAACQQCDQMMSDCGAICSNAWVDCSKTECGCGQARCYDFRCEAGMTGYCAPDCNLQPFSPCMPDHPGEMRTLGTATSTNVNWQNYNMAYRFKPTAPVTLTALGGLFNGTKTVRVYDQATSAVVAQTVHTSANSFSYTPVPATALDPTRTYAVAVWIQGGGASKGGFTNPTTIGKINITCAGTYGFSQTSAPANAYCFGTYYGMADMEVF